MSGVGRPRPDEGNHDLALAVRSSFGYNTFKVFWTYSVLRARFFISRRRPSESALRTQHFELGPSRNFARDRGAHDLPLSVSAIPPHAWSPGLTSLFGCCISAGGRGSSLSRTW